MLLASHKIIVHDFLRKMSTVIVFALSDRQNSSLSFLLEKKTFNKNFYKYKSYTERLGGMLLNKVKNQKRKKITWWHFPLTKKIMYKNEMKEWQREEKNMYKTHSTLSTLPTTHNLAITALTVLFTRIQSTPLSIINLSHGSIHQNHFGLRFFL